MKYGLFMKKDNKLLEFQELKDLYEFILKAQLEIDSYKIYKLKDVL